MIGISLGRGKAEFTYQQLREHRLNQCHFINQRCSAGMLLIVPMHESNQDEAVYLPKPHTEPLMIRAMTSRIRPRLPTY